MTIIVSNHRPFTVLPASAPGEAMITPNFSSSSLRGCPLQQRASLFSPSALFVLGKEESSAEYKMEPLPGQPDWYPEHLHITIDDGPRLGDDRLPNMLDALAKHRVKATFFFTGKNINRHFEKNPERTRRILQRLTGEGHQIGYHSYQHCRRADASGCTKRFDQFTPAEITGDFDRFQKALDAALGRHYEIKVGRMPGGSGTTKKHVIAAFKEKGLEPPKYWHTTTEQWERGIKNPNRFAKEIKEKTEGGRHHILLLHESRRVGKQIDAFLTALKRQGTDSRP